MGEINGARRRETAGAEWSEPPTPLSNSGATERSRAASPAPAPWNVDYDKIPAGVRQYDEALFTNPALLGTRVSAPAGAPAGGASADAAWDAVARSPMPTLRGVQPPSGDVPLATADNARLLADRGVSLERALERSLIVSVADLEKFIDEYTAYTATRPELAMQHKDALRTGPQIFARRLDTELAEQQKAAEESRMRDRLGPLQVRPPIPMQQRVAVGEVAIPIAKAVDEVVKLTPIAGEVLLAAEAITGKTLGGLGYDIERSERLVSTALLLAPFAASALVSGVRGAVQLARLARATGKTTGETRRLLGAVRTIEKNQVALREGLAAKKAGRALTSAQTEAFRETDKALRQLRGAAAQSIFDVRSGSGLPVRSYAPNANGAVRTLDEATAIARKNGVVIPPWMTVVIDPRVREAHNYAEYRLGRTMTETSLVSWSELTNEGGQVLVRIHPSVLASDEKIVGVLQHEAWELGELRSRVEANRMLPAKQVQKLIDPKSAKNLHGQAWDIADLRVLMMREQDAVRKATLAGRLEVLMNRYRAENSR